MGPILFVSAVIFFKLDVHELLVLFDDVPTGFTDLKDCIFG